MGVVVVATKKEELERENQTYELCISFEEEEGAKKEDLKIRYYNIAEGEDKKATGKGPCRWQ
jgi:hypothetical protein